MGDFDLDNDGNIDGIAFLHSGYGAETQKPDCNGVDHTDRIWSHKWMMTPDWTSNDGVTVARYHISPALWGSCGSEIGRIGVIAHATGHFFGLPDLYDGKHGSGIGSFCLMANSWGVDGSQFYPPVASSWAKIEVGWMTATEITESGSYELAPLANVAQAYKIQAGYPDGEYLLIENRQAIGRDAKLWDAGLVIYHIDEAAAFGTEGFPGQSGTFHSWPENGKHYKVALLAPDGAYDLENEKNRGDAGDIWTGRGSATELGPSSNPKTGPFPNTDAYQRGIVKKTGIRIFSIRAAGQKMVFDVEIPQR